MKIFLATIPAAFLVATALYLWLFPSLAPLWVWLGDHELLVKIAATLLAGVAAWMSEFLANGLIARMEIAQLRRSAQILTFANYAAIPVSLGAMASLLLPYLGLAATMVGDEIVPLVFAILAVCGAVGSAQGKLLHQLPVQDRSPLLQFFLPSADKAMAIDQRRPIVYLRPFRNETRSMAERLGDRTLETLKSDGIYLFPYEPNNFTFLLSGFWRRGFLQNRRPLFDEQIVLAAFFSKLGPYVAIGRPHESFANMDLGALKTYVPDDRWQRRVLELLQSDALVILEAGDTPSLLWEVEQVTSTVEPRRVLLLLPFADSEYDVFRKLTHRAFPKALPVDRSPSRFIMFDDDWSPVELRNADHSVARTLAPWCQRNRLLH